MHRRQATPGNSARSRSRRERAASIFIRSVSETLPICSMPYSSLEGDFIKFFDRDAGDFLVACAPAFLHLLGPCGVVAPLSLELVQFGSALTFLDGVLEGVEQ